MSKITIERKLIHHIPVLELVETNKKNDRLPLAVVLHGITNQKEKGLEPGYELAKQGMRVIIPDAFLHGERKNEPYSGGKETEFWSIIWRSLEELPYLVDHYVTENLALNSRIHVTGLSMGAITTCMALVKYPWIYAGAALMGNPDPIGFTEWILSSHWVDGVEDNTVNKDDVIQLMAPFRELSLKEYPEKIAGRPFYIWHGTADKSVPFEQMDGFIKEIADEAYAKKINYNYAEGHGHKVPYEVFAEMAEFLGKQ